MHISLGLNSRRRRTTTEESTNTSQQSDDNTSDEANTTNHSYWRVRLPDDELDNLMWGERGVPSPPSSPPPSRFRQQWARDPKEEHEKDVPADNVSDASSSSESPPANDNILTALDGNGTVVHSLDGAADNGPAGSLPPPPPDAPPPPPPDHPPAIPPPDDPILLEDILWKQRSGLGKYSLGILQHEWEQRRVVLFRSGMLRYYALPSCVEGVIYDPDGENGDEKSGNGSPWVYKKVEPRGEMYLGRRRRKKKKRGASDAPASFGDHVRAGETNGTENSTTSHRRERGAKIRVRTKRTRSSGPTPFEIKVTKRNHSRETWRLCFLSEWERNHWLEAMSQFTKPKGWEPMEGGDDGIETDEREPAAEANDEFHVSEEEEEEEEDSSTFSDDSSSSSSSSSSSDDDHPSNGLGDHGFQPGDHILRWEMLPIIYPIQIHGIVLEAGKNCVIIADFGLASYDPSSEKTMRKKRDGLTTWEDERKDDDVSHDVILAAWEKIKPREKKRLNVVVVTDPKEIRKWSKISYGDRVEESSDELNNKKKKKKKKKKGFFDKLTFGGKSPRHSKDKQRRKKGSHDDTFRSDEEGETATVVTANGDNNNRAKAFSHDGSDHFTLEDGNSTFDADEDEAEDEEEYFEGEPEWFRSGYKPRRRTNSTSSAKSGSWDGGGQSVFSIDHHDRPPSKTELPKSDSAKLVLARTHFILENEDLLPPYHVFYSNSECIAVWCKTGRWSTLQAAVYLVSSSVGFGKSATMLTISVAAAHAILLPAVAVGGLAVVGAPLLFLKKSQEKWEKTTMKLTGEFWARAPPEVFVEAIEYWGGLRVG